MSGQIAPIRDAATVLLLRPAEAGYEIYMVRRSRKSAFMPDAMVFPGGRLDEADASPEVLAACDLTPAQAAERLFMPAEEGAAALALMVAAVRETFEESGLLLASQGGDALVNLNAPEAAERFGAWRARLNDREDLDGHFDAIVKAEGLTLTVSSMGYFARWITPPVESRRFDARFFIALAPEAQQPVADARETFDGTWLSPADAVSAYERGEIELAPPTLRILLTLRDEATDLESALGLRAGAPPPCIQPQAQANEAGFALLLPGDPDFEGPDEGLPAGQTNRVILEDGKWRSIGKGC